MLRLLAGWLEEEVEGGRVSNQSSEWIRTYIHTYIARRSRLAWLPLQYGERIGSHRNESQSACLEMTKGRRTG
jgi:hypothetical protein